MKFFTLCADDFAQSLAISDGILQLLMAGRLNAVSCLTKSPAWPGDARKLRKIAGDHEVGLHFNLTIPFGRNRCRVSTLLAAAILGVIDRKAILSCFDDQWDAFVRGYGKPPAFVDGHQHVHVFPGIRDVITERARQRNPDCWIRSLKSPTPPRLFKERLLARFARAPFTTTNRWFAGFRPYRAGYDFREFFRELLHGCPDDTLVMCHPGIASKDPGDPIAKSRSAELEYLLSEDFTRDCRMAGVIFRPLSRRASPRSLPTPVEVDMLGS